MINVICNLCRFTLVSNTRVKRGKEKNEGKYGNVKHFVVDDATNCVFEKTKYTKLGKKKKKKEAGKLPQQQQKRKVNLSSINVRESKKYI